ENAVIGVSEVVQTDAAAEVMIAGGTFPQIVCSQRKSPHSGRMKIAHRFHRWDQAGIRRRSPLSERLKLKPGDDELSRPLHGLRIGLVRFPSTEVLRYFRSSAARTNQARPHVGCCPATRSLPRAVP